MLQLTGAAEPCACMWPSLRCVATRRSDLPAGVRSPFQKVTTMPWIHCRGPGLGALLQIIIHARVRIQRISTAPRGATSTAPSTGKMGSETWTPQRGPRTPDGCPSPRTSSGMAQAIQHGSKPVAAYHYTSTMGSSRWRMSVRSSVSCRPRRRS